MIEPDYSRSAYNDFTYNEYKPGYIDPLRHREPVPSNLRSSEFRPSNSLNGDIPSNTQSQLSDKVGSYGDRSSNNQSVDIPRQSSTQYNPHNTGGSYGDRPSYSPYDNKPYQKSNGGMYGDRYPPKVTIREPTQETLDKENRNNGSAGRRKNLRTFQSYNEPMGPDIRYNNNTGPDYRSQKYSPVPFKPRAGQYDWSRQNVDPVTNWNEYKGRNVGIYNGSVDYKLTEDNNLGMRHWDNNFVDDTVYAQQADRSHPRERNQKPVKSNRGPVVENYFTPVYAAAPPVQKKSKTQTTQTQKVKTKTFATQSASTKTKSLSVQTKPQKDETKVPVITEKVANITNSNIVKAKTPVSTKTTSIQTMPHIIRIDGSFSPRRFGKHTKRTIVNPKKPTVSKSIAPRSKPKTSLKTTKVKASQTILTYGIPVESTPIKPKPKAVPNVSVYMRYRGQPMYVSAEELAENETEKAQFANKMIHNAVTTVKRYKELSSMPNEISGLNVVTETAEPKLVKQIPGLEVYQSNPGKMSKSQLSNMPNEISGLRLGKGVSEPKLIKEIPGLQIYQSSPDPRSTSQMTYMPNEMTGRRLGKGVAEPKLNTQIPGLDIYQSNPDPRSKSQMTYIPNSHRASDPKFITEIPGLQIYQSNPDSNSLLSIVPNTYR